MEEKSYFYGGGGFYRLDIHKQIPAGSVEISEGLYQSLLEGQAKGKRIIPPDDNHPLPYLGEPAGPTKEVLENNVRSERDTRIATTDYLLMPDYQISKEELDAVLAYRQSLRDFPSLEGFPWDGEAEVPWPELPAWIVPSARSR